MSDCYRKNLLGGGKQGKEAFSNEIITELIESARTCSEAAGLSDTALKRIVRDAVQDKLIQLNHHFKGLIDSNYAHPQPLKDFDFDFVEYADYNEHPERFRQLDAEIDERVAKGAPSRGKSNEEVPKDLSEK